MFKSILDDNAFVIDNFLPNKEASPSFNITLSIFTPLSNVFSMIESVITWSACISLSFNNTPSILTPLFNVFSSIVSVFKLVIFTPLMLSCSILSTFKVPKTSKSVIDTPVKFKLLAVRVSQDKSAPVIWTPMISTPAPVVISSILEQLRVPVIDCVIVNISEASTVPTSQLRAIISLVWTWLTSISYNLPCNKFLILIFII